MSYDIIYITVISPDGIRTLYKVSEFLQLTLRDLFRNDECGGTCKLTRGGCSKCHIKVLGGETKIPMITPDEKAMLNIIKDVEHNSRLACKIGIKASMNGLIISVV